MSLSPRKLSETCRECKAPPLYACVHPVLGCSLASFHLQPTTVGEEIEPEARALSSGALRALHPVSAHQNDCSAAECGGEFTCEGCARVVGWCLGSGDLLGKEHCDDCWRDRLA
ncbi:MAG TPA: hypothetical protein VK745_16565, partial [Polyangiaceae bacterium]|nr:hypothetical protein [Polyangiaceae bacterium]